MAHATLTTYAKALKADLQESGLTQEELARRIGTKQQTVSGWLRGKSVPRPEYHDKLVAALGKYCAISAIPPRGEIWLMSEARSGSVDVDAVTDVPFHHVAEEPAPYLTAKSDDYGDKLADLFNRLPQDSVVRAMAFSQCAQVLFALLSPKPALAVTHAPERRHE